MPKIKRKENTDKELKKELLEKKETLRNFRFGSAGSHTKNVRHGRTLRKEIARILTELRARESAQ